MADSNAAGGASGLSDNAAGAIAYLTFIPAVFFLVMEPYNKDRFIRFHSFQCLFFAAAMVVLSIVTMIVAAVLAFIPIIGWLIDMLLWLVILFGSLGLVIFLIYKAANGQKFLLPVIGNLAEQQAAK